MSSRTSSKYTGVVGAGQFGTVVAGLLAEKTPVLLYVRNKEKATQIEKTRQHLGRPLHARIHITTSLVKIAEECSTIFPIVPSDAFSGLMTQMSPYLRPSHILIHGTKGFGLKEHVKITQKSIQRNDIQTISQLIQEKTNVLRIGCISGPNISHEIAKKLPAATIIASKYEEVIQEGKRLLKNDHFLVFGSKDIIGVELCGALKNIIAIGIGLLDSLNLGNNAKALLISRGMLDIVKISNFLGGNPNAFLGLAGIGDTITSCFSPVGRNLQVGQLLAQGRSLQDIREKLKETAEGIRTVDIIMKLSRTYKMRFLVVEILYKIIHTKMTIPYAMQLLMKQPFTYETYQFLP